jgi:hypothetical protein
MRGHPDWQVNTGQFSFLDMDTAEAMVRLGSPNVYTRSGRVLYIDSFEDNLSPWVVDGSGVGYAAALATDRVMHGSRSCKLTPGSTVGKYAKIVKRFPLIRSANMGIEVLFSQAIAATSIQFGLETVSGGELYRFGFKGSSDTGKLEIEISPAGTFVTIDTIGQLRSANPDWRLLKAVVDPVTHYWKSLQLNAEKWDLSDYLGVFEVGGAPDRVLVQYFGYDTSGVQSPTWLDSFILTIDEP